MLSISPSTIGKNTKIVRLNVCDMGSNVMVGIRTSTTPS